MNTPPRKQVETGLYGPVWAEFNRLIDYVREISPTGKTVRRTLNGSVVSDTSTQTERSTVRLLRLKEIGADWLRCRSWGGTDDIEDDGETDIYIARDPELQRTRFDGETIAYSSDGDTFSATFAYTSNTKRTKTVSGTAETQVITPLYKVDFTVITAVTVKGPTGVTTPAGSAVTMLEVTQRAWTKN